MVTGDTTAAVLTLDALQFPLAILQKLAGVLLYIIGWQIVQLFYYVNTGGFLYLPLECRKCDTSRHPITPSGELIILQRATSELTGRK